MSLFRTLDRTTCTSAVSNKSTARPILTFLCPVLAQTAPKRSFNKRAASRAPKLTSPSVDFMDSFFIQALARAGSCPEHARRISSLQNNALFKSDHHKTRRKIIRCSHERRQSISHTGERTGPFKKIRQFAEKELKALVDYYGIELDTRPEPEPVDDSGLLIWNVGDDHTPYPLRNEGDGAHIERLKELLKQEYPSHDDIFRTYRYLPSPGVVYLELPTIRKLLHHLAIVERPSHVSMQRFLSILDDMKTAHIHITSSEWTSAIHLTGKHMGRITADEAQAALYIWRDMEKRAGIKGGHVTFNVLFSIAVKAGKYALAESFLKEMTARNLKIHRHFRASLLYYYGVMQNGNAVRRTYLEIVDAGDIVDTVVMNAVIAALFRAGEPSAAEHVFEKMKRLNAGKSKSSSKQKSYIGRNWRQRRKLSLELTYKTRELDPEQDAKKIKVIQDSAPIAPDSRTYGLLIRHFSSIGNIDRIHQLLQEMHHNSIPLEGTIFIVIFHGFNSFGGVRYSSWTRDKLEKTWKEYLKAVEDKLERTWISSMAVIAALKAFRRCTDTERTLRAWEEVRGLWHPNKQELEQVLEVLRKLAPQDGFFDERRL